MKKRKILGIDYGDFTIGLAIFDLETDFIYPYRTIFRAKANILRKSIREITEAVKIENITDIVIGLPLNADGTEGERVEKVKSFARMLSNGLLNAGVDTIRANRRGEQCEPAKCIGEFHEPKKCTGEFHEPKKCTGEFHEPSIPIVFQDERLTTVEAKSILQERGIPKTDWKKSIDQIAAEIILQDYKQANINTNGRIFTIATININSLCRFNHKIIVQSGYIINKHSEELRIANLLKDEMGGVIELLKESNINGEKTPDYLWDNRLWELKNISTKSSIDGQVRKAIKQIWKNSGGMILNITNSVLSEDEVLNITYDRISRVANKINQINIILVKGLKVIKMVRIEKKSYTTTTITGN